MGWPMLAVALAGLTTSSSWGQTTFTNFSLTATELRDRLYDTTTGAALLRAPIHAAVMHLMDEAVRKNPGVLSTADAAQVMRNVINSMTNDFGSQPQFSVDDMISRALPYLQKELSQKIPAKTMDAIQTGWNILVVAEQQGLFSTVYSNLTTAFPSGTVFPDFVNTASAIQALQRQAGSRARSLALPERIRAASDPAFGAAAAQVMSDVTTISPQDALETIVTNIPALLNSPFVQKLVHTVQTAGQVVVEFNELVASVTNTLGSLHRAVSDNAAVLGEVAGQQTDFLNGPIDPQVAAQGLARVQLVSHAISDAMDTTEHVVNFASTLIKLGGDSKLAQQVATVGASVIKVAEAVKKVSDVANVLGGVFSAASAFATGNYIGAALDMFSMFSGPSGPSPNQIILEQISAVRQDIADLRNNMNERFDRVDAALTNIMEKIDYSLMLITNDFNYVINNLDQIKGSLYDLQGQLHRMESDTYSYLTSISDYWLNLALNGGLAYETTYGLPMDYATFQGFENTLYTWAYNNSSDPLHEPVPVNCPSCYAIGGLFDQLTLHGFPEENVGYINNFIYSALGLPKPFGGVSALANPRVWSITANAYSQLCMENPTWFRETAAYRLNNIIAVGYNLNTFLNRLIASNTNAPNTELWTNVCNGYRNALQTFTNAVQASLAAFASTNGLPAGFDPFTNQFLSVVTPKTNTMRDGYYPTATVVSVTAMANSPTADGMPIYFLDQNTLRSLDANGLITTLAGNTNAGFRDGAEALFNNAQGLAVGPNGTVYIADTDNHAIRAWTPGGVVTTLAGFIPGTNGAAPVSGAVDGTNSLARFNSPHGLIMDNERNLLVADTLNHVVRKVTPAGAVSTWAGTLALGGVRNGRTVAAAEGNNALIAQFWTPGGLAVGANSLVYVLDTFTRLVRTVDTNGVVTTYRPQNTPLLHFFPQALAKDLDTLQARALSWPIAEIAAGGYPDTLSTSVGYGTIWHALSVLLRADGTLAARGDPMTIPRYDVDFHAPAGLTNIVAVAASSRSQSIALKSDGTVIPLGEGSVPTGFTNIVSIAAGSSQSLALRADGTVVAWSSAQKSLPQGLTNVVALAAGGDHYLALRDNGSVVAWTNDGTLQTNLPLTLTNVVAIAASATDDLGMTHSLALKGDGSVVAWGDNSQQQCNVPAGLNNVVAIAAGLGHSLALKADGHVVAFGQGLYYEDNSDGGNTVDSGVTSSMPASMTNVQWIADFSFYAMASKKDGGVVTWGGGSGLQPPGSIRVPSFSDPPPQSLDTYATNAAVQQFTTGVIMPDGQILVADKFGLRLFDYSDRLQRQAAAYLVTDLSNTSGNLHQAGKALKAWHLLLQTLATYALSDALSTDDALHALLFSRDGLLDTDSAVNFLTNLVTKSDWRPTHTTLAGVAQQRIDLLQSRILNAVTQLAQKPNPASLPLVTDTLSRLNLLLASHDQPIPAPALDMKPGTNQTLQVTLNGYPYLHYALQSSADLGTWSGNLGVFKDSSTTNLNPTAAQKKFLRAVQAQ